MKKETNPHIDAAWSRVSSKKNDPKKTLTVTDAVVLIVSIVVGAGIFRTPAIVASQTGSWELFFSVWGLGSIISLTGAMCYAELTSTFPNTGGDYHFLHRAFGRYFAFLFAWARMSIIQTGAIALLAFIIGDYMTALLPLGQHSPAIYAATIVVVLTFINIIGIHVGTRLQKVLFGVQFIGIFIFVILGLLFKVEEEMIYTSSTGGTDDMVRGIGAAMVMVLLTFGGWNEAGYISSEMRGGSKKMAIVMVVSITVITLIYFLINLVYLRLLGMEAMAESDAIGVEVMRVVLGETGVIFIGLLVMLTAMTSTNATIFTGARTNHALGRDFSVFSFMGKWQHKTSTPVNALLVQGCITTILIVLGSFARSGFESMVDFTAPVFWFFILCTGIALFVLRYKEPHVKRPFKVPLYPILPLVFCLSSAYLFYSSLLFAGNGAWFGMGVLVLGLGFIFMIPKKEKNETV